ncbi:hypothetical protein TNCT_585101 [Trichonephila clavata]|uniref:Uncharacterized protein n=1 Tax=Trichonephila clavata TaxID=2740835 RepID=A0A8X6IIR4_TRICU|nr:hypothetical protein TNCT_585101 [Trichonephila clavata]
MADFSSRKTMDLTKSSGPGGIHRVMIDILGPHGIRRIWTSSRLGHLQREWRRPIIPIVKPDKHSLPREVLGPLLNPHL